jgi:hypothetical protein
MDFDDHDVMYPGNGPAYRRPPAARPPMATRNVYSCEAEGLDAKVVVMGNSGNSFNCAIAVTDLILSLLFSSGREN